MPSASASKPKLPPVKPSSCAHKIDVPHDSTRCHSNGLRAGATQPAGTASTATPTRAAMGDRSVMRRCSLAPLVAVLLVALAVPTVRAAERCTMSCRAEVAACLRSECGSARGAARRDCIETRCRGPLGCPARIRTLAYVVTRCRAQNGRFVGSQGLRIRRADCDPVTVMRSGGGGDVDHPGGLFFCGLRAKNRAGFGSVLAGVFQRIGVTPDGSGVVFEVTNQFQLIGKTQLADEQRGFFFVRTDGSGLHRL